MKWWVAQLAGWLFVGLLIIAVRPLDVVFMVIPCLTAGIIGYVTGRMDPWRY